MSVGHGKSKRYKDRFNSVFNRYFIITAAIVIAIIVVLGSTMTLTIASQWWNDKTDTLTRNAREIVKTADKLSDWNETDGITARTILKSTLMTMSMATESDYFVTDPKGKVVLCKDGDSGECSEHAAMQIPEKYMTRALRNGFSDYAADENFGYGKFIVAVPLRDGSGVAFAVEDAIEGLFPYILGILKTYLWMTLVVLGLSVIIIYYFSKSLTEPIYEMQEVTRHFAKGEFEHRANESYKKGYLSDFAKSLNKMADELAADEEAQRSFVANVSHELKTPMTSIGGFIDGMLDGTIPPEQQESYLKIVSNEVKRLSRTVVSMLNLSKIEAGEVNLAPVRYDIGTQIFETLLLFEKRINDKHIEVEGFEEMGSAYINADRDLINQVVYNLIDNAVKFTPENGTLSFFAKNSDGKTTVKIKNTCASDISENEISRLFDRFYKVDKSRSFDVKGVGLGLYIVKTIVNMHDGEISAVKGEDCIEFTFEIPD